MTLDEYEKMPMGEPTKPIEIGSKYQIKSDRKFKEGDHVYYYEVINITKTDYGESYESMLKYDIIKREDK